VTAVEADHLDTFGSFEAVEQAFLDFVRAGPADGLIAACVDDPGAARLLRAAGRGRGLAYGLSRHAMLRAINLAPEEYGTRFHLEEDGEPLGQLMIRLPGAHNVRNALGAIAAARHVGADVHAARRALASFRGVGRRFEVVGEAAGVVVVDDYAHHPTEVRAALSALRELNPSRLVAVFQPHLYSRTRDLLDDFARAFDNADTLVITDVYGAREEPIEGVSGQTLAARATMYGHRDVHYVPDKEDIPRYLTKLRGEEDLVITMGAGDIYQFGQAFLDLLRSDLAPAGAGANNHRE
jgi:UDP-N-acetylmuramate--alanine ligase